MPRPAEPSEAKLESVVIEVRKIDRKQWRIEGVDRSEKAWVFVFGSATRIRRLHPEEVTVPLSHFLLLDPDDFPIEKGQEILVHWKLDPERKARLAEQLTLLEAQ